MKKHSFPIEGIADVRTIAICAESLRMRAEALRAAGYVDAIPETWRNAALWLESEQGAMCIASVPEEKVPTASVGDSQENKMSDHEFMSAHGQDAPGMSCDTYDQCVRCGLVRHDYRHGGGQRSPNYPIYLVRGVHHATPPPCIGIVSETKGKDPATHLGDDDCG